MKKERAKSVDGYFSKVAREGAKKLAQELREGKSITAMGRVYGRLEDVEIVEYRCPICGKKMSELETDLYGMHLDCQDTLDTCGRDEGIDRDYMEQERAEADAEEDYLERARENDREGR